MNSTEQKFEWFMMTEFFGGLKDTDYYSSRDKSQT